MRRLWIFMIAGVILALGVIPAQAQATWECLYDFTLDDWGWQLDPVPDFPEGDLVGQYRDEDGIHGGVYIDLYRVIRIRKDFSEPISVTYFQLNYEREPGGGGYNATSLGVNVADQAGYLINQFASVNPLVDDATFGPAREMDLLEITWASPTFSSPPTDNGSVTIFSVYLEGEGTPPEDCTDEPPTQLTRPLQPMDRLVAFESIQQITAETITILANNAVIFAAKSDSLVSAVTDGTITLIEPLTPDKCYELFTPDLGPGELPTDAFDHCRVTLVGNLTSSGEYVELFSDTNNTPSAFIIHIAGVDGREYLQIATDVSTYAYEGQMVSAGCWLGRVLNLPAEDNGAIGTIVGLFNSVVGALIQVFGDSTDPFDALTAVWVLDGEDYVDAWGEYVLDPSDSAPCNTPEGYEGCMGDSRLEDPSQWQSSNGVSWVQPGALMAPGSYISAVYNLNPDRDPSVIVGAYSVPLGILNLQLGDAHDANNQVLGPATLELVAGAADEGEFYTFQMENTGETPVRIDFICILHTLDRDGNPTQSPEKPSTKICYFTDSTFDHGLDEWDQTGDVEEDDGALLLGDGDTIEQDLKLKAGTYTLSVVTEVWGTAAYEPDDDNTTGGIEIEYAYPTTSFTSMGTKSWAKYTHRTQTFTATITLADDEDEPFTLRAQIVSTPTGALGVAINSACLTKEGSTPTGDGDGLIQPTCGNIATPTLAATQPGTWFTWLWANLNKFYRCELIKVINQIYIVITNFFRTATWAIRWSQAAAIRAGNFANSTLYWLNGHLYNVAVGRIYVVEGGQQVDSAGDLGDVLLGGLKSVIDVFINLLQRVIDFVFYLLNLVFVIALDIVVALIRIGVIAIGMIISFMGSFFDALNAFYFAWNNSTAAPIAGLPQCAVEPKENPVCIILWVLENTIFSGRGFLFIPFIVAYGSAELLLWAIGKLLKQAQDSATGG